MFIVYLAGFLPALAGGALFARWLQFAEFPSTGKGAAVGGMYAAFSSAVFAIGLSMLDVQSAEEHRFWQNIVTGLPFLAYFSIHGAFAGAIVGAIETKNANKYSVRTPENCNLSPDNGPDKKP